MRYSYRLKGRLVTAYDASKWECPLCPELTEKALEYYEGNDTIRIWAIVSDEEEPEPVRFTFTFSRDDIKACEEIDSNRTYTEEELSKALEELADSPKMND